MVWVMLLLYYEMAKRAIGEMKEMEKEICLEVI